MAIIIVGQPSRETHSCHFLSVADGLERHFGAAHGFEIRVPPVMFLCKIYHYRLSYHTAFLSAVQEVIGISS